MTPLIALVLPAAWLADAERCVLHVVSAAQVDLIHFDVIDGQPVLRYPPTHLDTDPTKGDRP